MYPTNKFHLQVYNAFTFHTLKETSNSFKKWPLNLWWISNKTVMEVGNITKAATFKSFRHLCYKNTQLLFFVTVLFNIFIRQTLNNDFWGLHKNLNCVFPLNCKVNWPENIKGGRHIVLISKIFILIKIFIFTCLS